MIFLLVRFNYVNPTLKSGTFDLDMLIYIGYSLSVHDQSDQRSLGVIDKKNAETDDSKKKKI